MKRKAITLISVMVSIIILTFTIHTFAQSSKHQTMLDKDIKLNVKVSFPAKRMLTWKVMSILSKASGRRINCDATVLQALLVSLHDVKVKDIMDSISRATNLPWVKDGDSYSLKILFDHIGAYEEDNLQGIEELRLGVKIADLANDLSEDIKNRIQVQDSCHVKDLPLEMQNLLSSYIENQNAARQQESPDYNQSINKDNILDSMIMLKPKKNGSFHITLGLGNYGTTTDIGGQSTRSYFEYKDRIRKENIYDAKLEEDATLSHSEDKRFKKQISLKLSERNWDYTLLSLYEKLPDIDFVAVSFDPNFRQKIDIPQNFVPEVLDRITDYYPSRDWKLRKSGVIALCLSDKAKPGITVHFKKEKNQ